MNVNATSMNETNTFPLFHCNAKAFYERLITENTVMYVSKKTRGGRMRGESVYMCVREREKKNIDAKTMKYFHIWNMIVFFIKVLYLILIME